jgi:hypothetical protein
MRLRRSPMLRALVVVLALSLACPVVVPAQGKGLLQAAEASSEPISGVEKNAEASSEPSSDVKQNTTADGQRDTDGKDGYAAASAPKEYVRAFVNGAYEGEDAKGDDMNPHSRFCGCGVHTRILC